ncbi:MAG: glycosyl transferase, partial [Pseudomonadota bacterium]
MTVVDLAIVGDFRFPGGTSSCIASEIAALHGGGYQVLLIQIDSSILPSNRPINPLIGAAIERGEARMLAGAQGSIHARLAILHHPQSFDDIPEQFVRLRAPVRILVVHHAPADGAGIPYYDPRALHRNVEREFGEGVLWAPISPFIRDELSKAAPEITLHDEDWANFLDPREWRCPRERPVAEHPVIGRHSRPDLSKWPATASAMLAAYPDDPDILVRLLGVSDALRTIIDPFPDNWQTFRFNAMAPSAFLKTIDFFVYYHHPNLREAFGRTVLEALASGAVAVLPRHFEPMFGEAAIYRDLEEVVPTVRALHADWQCYREQSQRGVTFVTERLGPAAFLQRIERLIGPRPRLQAIRGGQAEAAVPQQQDVFDVLMLVDAAID